MNQYPVGINIRQQISHNIISRRALYKKDAIAKMSIQKQSYGITYFDYVYLIPCTEIDRKK